MRTLVIALSDQRQNLTVSSVIGQKANKFCSTSKKMKLNTVVEEIIKWQ